MDQNNLHFNKNNTKRLFFNAHVLELPWDALVSIIFPFWLYKNLYLLRMRYWVNIYRIWWYWPSHIVKTITFDGGDSSCLCENLATPSANKASSKSAEVKPFLDKTFESCMHDACSEYFTEEYIHTPCKL